MAVANRACAKSHEHRRMLTEADSRGLQSGCIPRKPWSLPFGLLGLHDPICTKTGSTSTPWEIEIQTVRAMGIPAGRGRSCHCHIMARCSGIYLCNKLTADYTANRTKQAYLPGSIAPSGLFSLRKDCKAYYTTNI